MVTCIFLTKSDYIDMNIGKATINLSECLLENNQQHFFIVDFSKVNI